jgi:alcohol dehydrogenase (cytochrome c)
MTNFRPRADTKNGLLIVDAHPSWSIYFAKPADGVYGWAGADYDVWGKADRRHRLSNRRSMEP